MASVTLPRGGGGGWSDFFCMDLHRLQGVIIMPGLARAGVAGQSRLHGSCILRMERPFNLPLLGPGVCISHLMPAQHPTCSNSCQRLRQSHPHHAPRVMQIEYTDGTSEGAAMPKDELTHAAYWELMGFEDPTPPEKQREFAKCGAQCGSTVHDEDADDGEVPHR